MEQATHGRRLLIETWTNKQVSFRGFLADLAAKKVKWGELMFAMTAKEKTTNRIGRLFNYSTLRVRTFSSTLERNMKDSIFPDVAEQTKTLSEVQLHKKFMEHGSSLKPGRRRMWRVLISLDFRKWCWHFSTSNAGPALKLLDELFGFDEADTRAYEIAQQLFGLCAFLPLFRHQTTSGAAAE